MRPSRLLVVLAIALLGLTVLIALLGIQGANLVFVMWFALAAIAMIDLLVTPGKRSLQIVAQTTDQVFVGTTVHAPFEITTKSLPKALSLAFDTSEGLIVGHDGLRVTDDGAEGELNLTCTRRGTFALDHIWMQWPSRFGLFDVIAKKIFNQTVKGIPNVQPILSGEITTQVNTELYGIKTTAMRGEGSDFHQLRDFTTGMDPRMIDWKRSARHNTLVARETHVEQNHQIILCVDNGYLMREEIAGLPKIDHAIHSALALTWAAGIGGDQVGFYSFDSRPQRYLPPQPGRQAFNRIRAEAAEMDYVSVESNHTLAMAHLNGQLNRRSLIVVFSDFVDSITAELLVENIGVLSKHHVLVFVALRDPSIEAFRSPDDLSMDNIALAVSAAQVTQERARVFDTLRRLGVICLDVEPGQVTADLISTYIDIKSKEMI